MSTIYEPKLPKELNICFPFIILGFLIAIYEL